MLKIITSRPVSAKKNMDRDADLLNQLNQYSDPILHFYEWESPSITYGYFIMPNKIFNYEALAKHNIDIARRPTGGGVVFHIWDLAFSFLMPRTHPFFSLNTLENYAFVNNIVLKAIKQMLHKTKVTLTLEDAQVDLSLQKHFCMARPTKYDVIFQGKKVAGAAQRKTKLGYLHQGTISLAMPNEQIVNDVLLNEEIYKAMLANTYAPLKADVSLKELNELRENMKKNLTHFFKQELQGALSV
ncbi:MAG: hypothetical protein COT84_02180 [Chlamydiae bacterium CG10_big_fil_rev_8_21_14_0_10_35_9]|nr:MAG: hypothetical protein COT84_02180 [Chlamydiae bacterium CG10_big_fil_rev_8_21_14_0_10_35_9]